MNNFAAPQKYRQCQASTHTSSLFQSPKGKSIDFDQKLADG
jgi:hypothetical protein